MYVSEWMLLGLLQSNFWLVDKFYSFSLCSFFSSFFPLAFSSPYLQPPHPHSGCSCTIISFVADENCNFTKTFLFFFSIFIKKSILFFFHETDYFSSSFYTTIPPKTGLLYMCASRNIISGSFSHHHEMIVHGWQDVKIQLLTYLTNLLLFPAFTFNSG